MERVPNAGRHTRRSADKVADLLRTSTLAKVLIVGAAVLMALAAFGVIYALTAPVAAAPNLASEHLAGVFADINGDGLTDYIVNAEVIVNKGPLAP